MNPICLEWNHTSSMSRLHQACQSRGDGYLQQRVDYVNQAAALWDFKRFFVLSLFRGESGVVAAGRVGVRGN